jgi:hypothetical protein
MGLALIATTLRLTQKNSDLWLMFFWLALITAVVTATLLVTLYIREVLRALNKLAAATPVPVEPPRLGPIQTRAFRDTKNKDFSTYVPPEEELDTWLAEHDGRIVVESVGGAWVKESGGTYGLLENWWVCFREILGPRPSQPTVAEQGGEDTAT